MDARKKTLLTVTVFLISLTIGLVTTRFLNSPKSDSSEPVYLTRVVTQNDTIQSNDTIKAISTVIEYKDRVIDGDTLFGEGTVIDRYEQIVRIDSPILEPVGETTTENPSGINEKKKVKIRREEINPAPTPPQPYKKVNPLMTKAELQNLINNTSDNSLEGGGNEKVRNVFEIKVKDAPGITRVAPVREKIETGQWKRVKVVDMQYDNETGQITGATLEYE